MKNKNFHSSLEKEILIKDVPALVSLLQEANEILKEELNYQLLKSDRPMGVAWILVG